MAESNFKRPLFSSKMATILTMVGVSIGLGNVWRFPYMMGLYGGSAFLFLYFIFTLLFALPAVMAEWAVGRKTRSGPLGAFTNIFGPTAGYFFGFLLLVTVVVADSYYLVVIGNVTYTAFYSIGYGFSDETLSGYQSGLGNGYLQYLICFILLILSIWILYKGLKKGIESVSKIFVPFFAVTIILIIIYVFTIEGVVEKMLTFLTPDLGAIDTSVVFAAMGQSFFSLGLGGTFLLIYGSYLKKEEAIPSGSFMTAMGDLLAALMAALFIIPSILVFGLQMTSGPGLIFETLPVLFSKMPFGRVVGSFFLIALTMVAFLSNIAALEVFSMGITDFKKVKLNRNKILIFLLVIEAILMLHSTINPSLIGTLDLVFGSGMQTLGSGITLIALTWGLGRKKALQQIFGKTDGFWENAYFIWTKWFVPGALLVILITYIYDQF